MQARMVIRSSSGEVATPWEEADADFLARWPALAEAPARVAFGAARIRVADERLVLEGEPPAETGLYLESRP